ncbi:MAG: hypothetical protein QM775_27170 [Pirellulales bacterium]
MSQNPYQQPTQDDAAEVPAGIWIAQVILFVIVFAAMLNAVPPAIRVFKDFDAELPSPTIFLIRAYDEFRKHWYVGVGAWLAAMASIFALWQAGERTERNGCRPGSSCWKSSGCCSWPRRSTCRCTCSHRS